MYQEVPEVGTRQAYLSDQQVKIYQTIYTTPRVLTPGTSFVLKNP